MMVAGKGGLPTSDPVQTLVYTKLVSPRIPANVVRRERLITRLNENLRGVGGFTRKMTLVSAPPGFGKTTLVCEWLGSDSQVAWLTLDRQDGDLSRFLKYITAAIQRLIPDVGQNALDMLGITQEYSFEPMLNTLINDIAFAFDKEADFPESYLVLDDYHRVKAAQVQRAVRYFIDHIPSQLHLVIITREDPSFPLARERGRGHVLEIRTEDLRFNLIEAESFLTGTMNLDITSSEAAFLFKRTEGWIAGIQMMALSLQHSTRKLRSVELRKLVEGSQEVNDYFFEEVIEKLDSNIRDFVVRTSILDRLSGPLCDALTGREDGQATLIHLERANLFVAPLDEEYRWYRYHPLFSDLLRSYLKKSASELESDLHQRAIEWFESNKMPEPAIEQAFAAGDEYKAASLIERQVETVLRRGELTTVSGWLEQLSLPVLRSHPVLAAYRALFAILGNKSMDEIDNLMNQVVEIKDIGNIRGEVAVIKAVMATVRGELRESHRLSNEALEQLPKDRYFFRNLVSRNLAAAYRAAGHIEPTRRILEATVREAELSADNLGQIVTLNMLVEVCIAQGRLFEAKDLCLGALDLAVDVRGRYLPLAARLLFNLGDIHREWNDLQLAAAHIEEGIGVAESWSDIWALKGYLYLGLINQATGDISGARDAMSSARRIAVVYDATDLDDILVAGYQARLSLFQGNVGAALRWAKERRLDKDITSILNELELLDSTDMYALIEFEHIVLSRLLLATAKEEEAALLVEKLLERAQKLGRSGPSIELHLILASAYDKLGMKDKSYRSLSTAISLAEPEGYLRVFLDMGPDIPRLISLARENDPLPAYADEIMQVFTSVEVISVPPQIPSPGLSEPLSPREIQVLRMLSSHLTGTEIAEALTLSPNTVRFHMKNIYSKLDVHSRSQAVERARQAGIL